MLNVLGNHGKKILSTFILYFFAKLNSTFLWRPYMPCIFFITGFIRCGIISLICFSYISFLQASVCLELCCSALWTHISHQCRCFSQKSGDISEESIKDYVSDACTTTAIYLGALHECCSPDINKVIVDSLNHWAKARDLLNVAGPDALVKKWVKV